jgi:hypothetical protein
VDLRLLLQGCVELWSRERGLERISAAYPPSFYMHLKDPHAHWEMIQALESRYRVEACSFNSIFGTFEGHRIFASRKVAEKIEIQTRYAAELYNVDVRQDQRYLAEWVCFLVETGTSPGSLPTPYSLEHPGNGGSRRSKLSQGDLLCPGPQ